MSEKMSGRKLTSFKRENKLSKMIINVSPYNFKAIFSS